MSHSAPSTPSRSVVRALSGSFNLPLEEGDGVRRGVKMRYDVIDQLSEGSTATVWKAIDNKTNELVALKIAHKTSAMGNLANFFRQEAKILQRLSHPNIIRVYDCTHRFVSMELMSECLFDFILDHNGLTTPIILGLFVQVVEAVAFIHSKGYCHRDIKLENVLLNRTHSTAKLADFGFATKTGRNIDCMFPGSPDYLAPEVACKKPYDGTSYDVWSLGILLYAMASRRFPFSKPDDSNEVIIDRIKSFDCFENCNSFEFSAEVESLLKRMLQKDPASRPTAAALLEDPILTPHIIPSKESPKDVPVRFKDRFTSFVSSFKGMTMSPTMSFRLVPGHNPPSDL